LGFAEIQTQNRLLYIVRTKRAIICYKLRAYY
jgi:hypothetical protein